MSNKIIVISRQFGSGGREIGKKLAEKLGIDFFDLGIIEMAAKRSGSDYNELLEVDEKKVGTKWYSFTAEADAQYSLRKIPINENLFQIQKQIILDVAEKKSCVIIGRGADYILKDKDKMMSVFVYADRETKLESIMRHYGLERSNALALMKKTDKQRRQYYNAYTEYSWGNMENYDLAINRSKYGIEGAVDILEEAYRIL